MKKTVFALVGLFSVMSISELNYAFAQTELNSGGVMAIRDVYLKDSVDHNAFESMILEQVIPTYEECNPGVEVVFLKGDRGRDKGAYKFVWIYESVDQRNYYWPEEGNNGGQGLGASTGELCQDKMGPVIEKWSTYIDTEKGQAGPQPGFTDFVVIE